MKFTEKPKLKMVFAAVCACLLLLAGVGVSFGAYNSQAAKRGVVRNRDTEKIRFTSNYLQPCAVNTENSAFPVRIIAFSENTSDDTQIPLDIWVYNYIVGSNSQINERDITYTLTITIQNGTKDSYTVKNGNDIISGKNNVYTAEKLTLTGRKESQNHFTIDITGADLNKIKIYAKAVPTDTSATGNQIIAAAIVPATSSSVQGFQCKGEFTDKTADPNQFDAFNYEVNVSGGAANVTLTWNAKVVEIDPFFLKKIGADANITPSSGSVTFKMDQTQGTGTYLIPFYIKDKSTFTSENASITWKQMESYISVTGEQIVSTQALD